MTPTAAASRPTPHERFDDFIKKSGLSGAEVARRIGCDRTYVWHVRTGRRNPGLRLAVAIQELTAGAIPAVDWLETDAAAVPPTGTDGA